MILASLAIMQKMEKCKKSALYLLGLENERNDRVHCNKAGKYGSACELINKLLIKYLFILKEYNYYPIVVRFMERLPWR